MDDERRTIRRNTTLVAILVASIVALGPAATHFVMSYSHIRGMLEAEAEINARLVRGLVLANPGLWQFEEVRLKELLQKRPRQKTHEIRRLYDLKKKVVAESADPVLPPTISYSCDIQDGGRTVATIEIVRSLAPTATTTALLLTLGLVVGIFSFFKLRMAPLRTIEAVQRVLRESEEKYRSVYESLKEGLALYRVIPGEEGEVELILTDINPVCETVFGFGSRDPGRSIDEICDGIFAPYHGKIASVLRNNKDVSFEMQHPGRDRFFTVTVFRAGGDRLATLLEDVTAEKRSAEQLERLAYYDSLTGLLNRRMLLDRLEQTIGVAQREQVNVAVLFIDLDGFKVINDTLGHEAGDQILIEVSERLQRSVRKRDTLARLGGDEFVVVSTYDKEQNAGYIAKNLLKCISGVYGVRGREVYLGASIGISVFPDDGDSSEVLLKNADIAMYSAKNHGGDFCFYRAELNQRLHQRMQLDFDLRRALEKDEFFFEYQPIIDARTGRISAVEALIRWNSPEKGRVMPDVFIGLAEETGLILPLGEWVVRKACAKLREWQEAGLPLVRMCINISGRQFMQGDIYNVVSSALKENGIDPRYLELELTETCLIQNVEETTKKLGMLKELNVSISVDDFGTGYSSLQYLKNFPIDRLKIDRGFIKNAPHFANHRAIVDAIIGIAKAMDLKVIAEGVETVEQAEFLKARNCDGLQGYYFYRPLAEEPLVVVLCSQGDEEAPPSHFLATRVLGPIENTLPAPFSATRSADPADKQASDPPSVVGGE
ncbi:EAL domain-containing protein [Geomonas sp. Red875]|uniref:EAL domain-containing protein n=1 Tax=Geomesophilobacter sediminis TaxID=2798584 RepID=A0A8J7M103_9BACT|nr:EAL domain-containing protein [Geomesophilobacter sediminis]